jgi:transposase
MPAPLRVILSDADREMLRELRVATTVPQRTRDRAHMLWLNGDGWNVPAIADMFDCHAHTVRATIRRWEAHGLSGLWEASGRGAKPRWNAADMAYIEGCLADETRTYNSSQIVRKLKEAGLVDLSSGQLRSILKKKLLLETHASKSPSQARSGKTGDEAGGPRDVETGSGRR